MASSLGIRVIPAVLPLLPLPLIQLPLLLGIEGIIPEVMETPLLGLLLLLWLRLILVCS